MLIFPSISSNGVLYHFEETFTGTLSDAWEFRATDHFPTAHPIESSYEVQNDRLVSAGEFTGNRTHGARIQDSTDIGIWSFEIEIPSTAEHDNWFDRLAAILISEKPMGNIDLYPNSTRYSNFAIWITTDAITLNVRSGDASLENQIKVEKPVKIDQIEHYEMILTNNAFFLAIDSEILIQTDRFNFPEFDNNYFTLSTGIGSGIAFDNIKISSDLSDVSYTLPTETSANNISSEGDANFSFRLFVYSVALLVVIRLKINANR